MSSIHQVAYQSEATKIGKFKEYGPSGAAVFELEDGTFQRGVFDPKGDLVPNVWKTLVRAGTEWHVWGEAGEAPQAADDIPTGPQSL